MSKTKATIIVPTYERPDALERQALFLSRYLEHDRYRVLVADGSRVASEKNHSICQQAGLEYIHYDPELYFVNRWIEAFMLIDTEIAMLLPDDDLIHPEGFTNCVEFLKHHPDYAVATGTYFNFKTTEKECIYRHDYWWQQSFEDDDCLNRLQGFLSTYFPIQYAVHRTENLLDAYKTLMAVFPHKSQYLEFMELLPACLYVLKGKLKSIPVSYMAREAGQSSKISSESRVALEDFVLSPSFLDDYRVFQQVLSKQAVSSDTSSSMDEIIASVDNAYSGYLLSFNRSPVAVTVFNTLTRTALRQSSLDRTSHFKSLYNTNDPPLRIQEQSPLLYKFLAEYPFTKAPTILHESVCPKTA